MDSFLELLDWLCTASRFMQEARLRYEEALKDTRLFLRGLRLSEADSGTMWEDEAESNMLVGHDRSRLHDESHEEEGSSMLSSFSTLALATSAKSPERKSEL